MTAMAHAFIGEGKRALSNMVFFVRSPLARSLARSLTRSLTLCQSNLHIGCRRASAGEMVWLSKSTILTQTGSK